MTLEFFEGPAGSGKTHSLIDRARQLVNQLSEGQRILALTFMNGARRRLETSLGKHAELRRRFECKTVDVFAQVIVSRRRSLLVECATEMEAAARLNQFDSKCHLAAHLLQFSCVAQWVAANYPLILIDEAQDLDVYRLSILRGLASACSILAAADAFQCLKDGMDTSPVISWLDSYGNATRLTGSQRTTQTGILRVAQAVRNAEDVRVGLVKHKNYAIWRAPGFKLLELPARHAFLARTISNELKDLSGTVAILSPDTGSKVVRDALELVCTRAWPYRKDNPETTFGPFTVEWDVNEDERAQDLCRQLELPEMCDLRNVAIGTAARVADPALIRVRARMERARRVSGERTFSNVRVNQMIEDAVRDVSRFGGRRGPLRAAMSIHRAKNREFKNVIVLWPYSVGGSADYLRRLLYNAITRAQQKCVVIALGKNRLCSAPFAPTSGQSAPAAPPNQRSSSARVRRRRKVASGLAT